MKSFAFTWTSYTVRIEGEKEWRSVVVTSSPELLDFICSGFCICGVSELHCTVPNYGLQVLRASGHSGNNTSHNIARWPSIDSENIGNEVWALQELIAQVLSFCFFTPTSSTVLKTIQLYGINSHSDFPQIRENGQQNFTGFHHDSLLEW